METLSYSVRQIRRIHYLRLIRFCTAVPLNSKILKNEINNAIQIDSNQVFYSVRLIQNIHYDRKINELKRLKLWLIERINLFY
jgi:hypothetical protein